MKALQSIGLIKSVHTAIFVVMNGAMTMLLYAVILDKITILRSSVRHKKLIAISQYGVDSENSLITKGL